MSLDQFFIVPFPSQIRASGSQLLGYLATVDFPGRVGRQTRRQIIVTNLSTTSDITLRKFNGVEFMTVFPRVALTIETADDVQLYNASGQVIILYQVCELFFDEGVIVQGIPMGDGRSGVQATAAGTNHAGFFGGSSTGGGPSRGSRP